MNILDFFLYLKNNNNLNINLTFNKILELLKETEKSFNFKLINEKMLDTTISNDSKQQSETANLDISELNISLQECEEPIEEDEKSSPPEKQDGAEFITNNEEGPNPIAIPKTQTLTRIGILKAKQHQLTESDYLNIIKKLKLKIDILYITRKTSLPHPIQEINKILFQCCEEYIRITKPIEQLVEEKLINQLASRSKNFNPFLKLFLLNPVSAEDSYTPEDSTETIKFNPTTYAHALIYNSKPNSDRLFQYFLMIKYATVNNRELLQNYLSLTDSSGQSIYNLLIQSKNNRILELLFPERVMNNINTHTSSIHSSIDQSIVRLTLSYCGKTNLENTHQSSLELNRTHEWHNKINQNILKLRQNIIDLINDDAAIRHILSILKPSKTIKEDDILILRFQFTKALKLVDNVISKRSFGSDPYIIDPNQINNSGLTLKEILAICYDLIFKRDQWHSKSEEDQKTQIVAFIKSLYIAQRGYNIDDAGSEEQDFVNYDASKPDNNKCIGGIINSVINSMRDHKYVSIKLINTAIMINALQMRLPKTLVDLINEKEIHPNDIISYLSSGNPNPSLLNMVTTKLSNDSAFRAEFTELDIRNHTSNAMIGLDITKLRADIKLLKPDLNLEQKIEYLIHSFVLHVAEISEGDNDLDELTNRSKGYIPYLTDLFYKDNYLAKKLLENIILDFTSKPTGKYAPLLNLLILSDPNLANYIETRFKFYEHNFNYDFLIHSCKYNLEQIAYFFIRLGIDPNYLDHKYRSPLFFATSNKNSHLAKLLLSNGADPNIQDLERGNSPLHIAVINKDYQLVEILINSNASPNIKNNDGNTPLHLAVTNKDLDLIRLLINSNISPNIKNNDGNTPLHLAVINKDLDLIRLLVKEKKVNLNLQNNDGNTALHLAAKQNYLEAIRALINAGANLDIQDKNGNTAIHLAAYSNFINIIYILLNSKADINAQNIEKRTILHIIIFNQLGDVALDLVKNYGAKIDIKDHKLLSPLATAIITRQLEFFKILIKEINDQNHLEELLNISIRENYYETCRLLIERGASLENNPQLRNYLLYSITTHSKYDNKILELLACSHVNLLTPNPELRFYPLHEACSSRNLAILQLSHDGQYDVRNEQNLTPLQVALESGWALGVYYLLENMYQIKKFNTKYELAISAIKSGNLDLINCFIRSDPELLVSNRDFNYYPLHTALERKNQNEDIINLFLTDNFIDEYNQGNHSALMLSIMNQSLIITSKIANRASPDAIEYFQTALICAVSQSKFDQSRFLMLRNPNLDFMFSYSENTETTLLHLAVKNNHLDLVKILVNSRATILINDSKNYTPLHYAISLKHNKIVEFLLKNIKDKKSVEFTDQNFLFYAIRSQNTNAAKLFIDQGINLSILNNLNALHIAINQGLFEVAELLIKNGVNINLHDSRSNTALDYAVIKNNFRISKLLIDANTNAHLDANASSRLISIAVDFGNLELVKLLFKDEFISNYNNSKMPILWNAINSGNLELVRFLLEKNVLDSVEKKESYVNIAISKRDSALLQLLLNNGFKLKETEFFLFEDLLKNEQIELVDILLTHMNELKDLNLRSLPPYYKKPLLFAAKKNNKLLEVLLKHGANPNITNDHGVTALHIATHTNNLKAFETLLDYGADPCARDIQNLTIFSYASESRNINIIKLLLNKLSLENSILTNIEHNIFDLVIEKQTHISFISSILLYYRQINMKPIIADRHISKILRFSRYDLFDLCVVNLKYDLNNINGKILFDNALAGNNINFIAYLGKFIRGKDNHRSYCIEGLNYFANQNNTIMIEFFISEIGKFNDDILRICLETIKNNNQNVLEILFKCHPELVNTNMIDFILASMKSGNFDLFLRVIEISRIFNPDSKISDLILLGPSKFEKQNTLINHAIIFKNIRVLEYLLENLPDRIHYLNNPHHPTLDLASNVELPEAVSLLIKFGANPRLINDEGLNPIFYAIRKRNYTITKMLLKYEPYSDTFNPKTLKNGIINNSEFDVFASLASGVSPNTRYRYTESEICSAIQIALRYKNYSIISKLLKKGAFIDETTTTMPEDYRNNNISTLIEIYKINKRHIRKLFTELTKQLKQDPSNEELRLSLVNNFVNEMNRLTEEPILLENLIEKIIKKVLKEVNNPRARSIEESSDAVCGKWSSIVLESRNSDLNISR